MARQWCHDGENMDESVMPGGWGERRDQCRCGATVNNRLLMGPPLRTLPYNEGGHKLISGNTVIGSQKEG